MTTTDALKLTEEAARAADLRGLATNPDVVALRVEKVRTQVDRLTWTGIILGLAFTMTNVQAFAAGAAEPRSLPWLAAWLLDPMVSLILIATIRSEQVTASWQVVPHAWVSRTKWFFLGATYVMNTWTAWARLTPSQIVLHSVPPLTVFFAAEVAPRLREGLTAAVLKAAERHKQAMGRDPFLTDPPQIVITDVLIPRRAPEPLPTTPEPLPTTPDPLPTSVETTPEQPEPDTGPIDTRPAMERAKDWFLAELAAGRERKPGEVNAQVGTSSYIKGSHLQTWKDEVRSATQPTL